MSDTTEMANALNTRLHREDLDRDAPTFAGAGGQPIGVGDLILIRRNDPTIDFHHSTPKAESLPSVRVDRQFVSGSSPVQAHGPDSADAEPDAEDDELADVPRDVLAEAEAAALVVIETYRRAQEGGR